MTRSLGQRRRYLKKLRARVSGRQSKTVANYECSCGATFFCRNKLHEHCGQFQHEPRQES